MHPKPNPSVLDESMFSLTTHFAAEAPASMLMKGKPEKFVVPAVAIGATDTTGSPKLDGRPIDPPEWGVWLGFNPARPHIWHYGVPDANAVAAVLRPQYRHAMLTAPYRDYIRGAVRSMPTMLWLPLYSSKGDDVFGNLNFRLIEKEPEEISAAMLCATPEP